MKKSMKRIIALTLAVVMAFLITTTAFPTETYAATKKNKVTATSGTKPTKKTPALKTGENVITYKKEAGWVKFTATKKGTYKFTFSNVASPEKNADQNGWGYFTIDDKDGKYYFPIVTKTDKGKNKYINITTKYCYKNYPDIAGDKYGYKRTATLSLKKGQTVYLYGSIIIGVKSAKHTVDIKITKKK